MRKCILSLSLMGMFPLAAVTPQPANSAKAISSENAQDAQKELEALQQRLEAFEKRDAWEKNVMNCITVAVVLVVAVGFGIMVKRIKNINSSLNSVNEDIDVMHNQINGMQVSIGNLILLNPEASAIAHSAFESGNAPDSD